MKSGSKDMREKMVFLKLINLHKEISRMVMKILLRVNQLKKICQKKE